MPRQLLETREALLKVPLAPLAHDLAGEVEALGNRLVLPALSRIENHLGPDHVTIRRRILPRDLLQGRAFGRPELEEKWALPWHLLSLRAWRDRSRRGGQPPEERRRCIYG